MRAMNAASVVFVSSTCWAAQLPSVGVTPAELIVSVNAFVAVPPPLTWTVKLAVVGVVGVPLMTPPLLRFKPAGRLPDVMDQVYGVEPPVAAKVVL
jgi:hypothetical protein